MCGIIAILRSATPQRLHADSLARQCREGLAEVLGVLESVVSVELGGDAIASLQSLSSTLEETVAAVRTPAGILQLMEDPDLLELVQTEVARCTALCDQIEARLDGTSVGSSSLRGREIERANVALLALRDDLWCIGRDGLGAVTGVKRLLARSGVQHFAAVSAALSIHQALSALDRLEVRGRDSAGLHLLCSRHGIDPTAPEIAASLDSRHSPLFENRGVRWVDDDSSGKTTLSLVVKVAREIGELGDNVRSLRGDLENDDLLAAALRSEQIEIAVLGHTRWASVGLITEANAHPLNQESLAAGDGDGQNGDGGNGDGQHGDVDPGVSEPYVVAALNGDVDNYVDLMTDADLAFVDEITTDAKVIPALVSRKIAFGMPLAEAFQETVSSFSGSVAIGLQSASSPQKLLLALCGSGQALYVGLGEDVFIVASEPYGVIELGKRYVRLDGETPGNPENPNGSRGQVMVLDGEQAGTLAGLSLAAYDGTVLPVTEGQVKVADLTTRDVDRGDFPHYFLKEISEAPRSFEKTLRGKLWQDGGELAVKLGPSSIPAPVAKRLSSGQVQRILVVGQGTAAVAGGGIAEVIQGLLGSHLREVRAMPATELSGFRMRADMSDTLVLAISQSGTTTDTNRTVDLVRARGASVLAIVNRRNSDLCDKADGVLLTSDGRDIEMSVASTKAFYSQVAAGVLMAVGLAEIILGGSAPKAQIAELLRALTLLPDALRRVLELRSEIDQIATKVAPPKRYWALVGNGFNRVAAEEIRIKLSELCYKSIACDATEDKKHIDLSSEPLILVCAAGLGGSTADDVAKEVAIYRAHKAIPVVIASEDEQRFNAASAVIRVPRVHPALDFVVASLAGHLFGYSAALAIDAQAKPLREIRTAIESLAHQWIEAKGDAEFFASLLQEARGSMQTFLDDLALGSYNGHLEASTGVELSLSLRTVMGQISLEAHEAMFGRLASPASVIESLSGALTQAIDELTRPVDAIKHQAKTVTVGISRSDEALLTVPLVKAVLAGGVHADEISYADLRTLATLDPVVAGVHGYTRYGLDRDPTEDGCVIREIEAGGLAKGVASRTENQPLLRGTKRRVALDRCLLVARGSADDRLFVLVPEVRAGGTRGLMLVHVELRSGASVEVLRSVLQGYRRRLGQLRDAVMETEESFREDLMLELSVEELLIEPVDKLALRWRRASGRSS